MEVTVLYIDGCPSWTVAVERVAALAEELGFVLTRRQITSPREAEEAGFRGSPTILVDGRDAFARGDEPAGLACRLYETPDGPRGAPTLAQLRARLT